MLSLIASSQAPETLGANITAFDFADDAVKGTIYFRTTPHFPGYATKDVYQSMENAIVYARKDMEEASPQSLLKAHAAFSRRLGEMLAAVPGLEYDSFRRNL